jgi:hypothetical protein
MQGPSRHFANVPITDEAISKKNLDDAGLACAAMRSALEVRLASTADMRQIQRRDNDAVNKPAKQRWD